MTLLHSVRNVSFPNWINFDSIVDSIVGFWQSGAKGLLIQTSLGNGFTTGAPWTNRSGFRECATAIILALSCNVLQNVVFAKSPPVCLGLHLRIWHRFGPLFLFHFHVSPAFFYLLFVPPTGGLSLCWPRAIPHYNDIEPGEQPLGFSFPCCSLGQTSETFP